MPKGYIKEHYIGEKIGNFTIIEIDKSKRKFIYKCKCICGNKIDVDSYHLNYNYKKNCGCIEGKTSFKDLTGQRFGQLVAIEPTHQRNHSKYRATEWICKCDCGKTVIRKSNTLRRGESVTCKIRGQHSKLGYGEASFNTVYSSTKSNAKKRDLEFSISRDEFHEISKERCYYCNCPPSQVSKPHNRKVGEYIYNGLDRVDNNLGYVIDNVVACCGRCNSAKGKESSESFKARIVRIYMNWASK